ncbi:FGGY-family carbohydrate kinase [Paraburkholderia susongensis]|uniref:Sugar (Pentulose or hexulose) kinase n=1 Tax=Paraburkholderia susongensis TaxID=1515439 RepID=A0A1X7M3P5_9BURK|nr:FGGY family carbohydrate kinase [Paraburkholderia susongensis]SMG60364.1 Sugar (pentulose or hexulose) kinase [Paraburkholderia susongensis]
MNPALNRAHDGRVVVFDIGKTNLKLSLIDEDGTSLSEARCANHAVHAGPYPHFDVDAIWHWLLCELERLPQRHRIGSIITTTHGATVALLGDEALALPVLDYEFTGLGEVDLAYASQRDDFGCTYSPALAGGLNVGKQLYWQARRFPDAFARTRAIVPYPQYWAWRLSGVVAGEVTSWGCHTDLWDVTRGRLAPMVSRLGWQSLIPPLREASATLGTLLPGLAARTGLPANCRVVCGIHDSNASMVKHFYGAPSPQAPLNVISSGTWTLVAGIGAPLSVLDPRRDMLANVDAWGRPLACARFMGGREFALLNAGQANDCRWEDIAALVARRTLALPSFAPLGGPWPDRSGEIRGPQPSSPQESYALATLYTALVTNDCLARLNSTGEIVIEGPLTANRHFAALLATMRPNQAVWISEDRSGTTGGAYLLACQPAGYEPPRSRALPRSIAYLPDYVADWRMLSECVAS